MNKKKAFVLWFKELGIKDVPLVGGKNASLGEMVRNLHGKGIDVPNGFAITAYAYFYLLNHTGLREEIKEVLKDLDTSNIRNLQAHGKKVRGLIFQAPWPQELVDVVAKAYQGMEKMYGKNVDVAVRSSATAEDLPDASFAGQQDTYLHIQGVDDLVMACRKCFASLFTDRAISYRADKKFDHFSIGLSIGVQKMVRSDKGCSGVMFSLDTESGFRDVVLINGSWGLGENIVQGAVTPDEFVVFKTTLKDKYVPILQRKLGSKLLKMIYQKSETGHTTVNIKATPKERQSFVINDKEVLKLAKWAMIIEKHYNKPMDMEWAKDGIDGKLYMVQARPETVQSRKNLSVLEEYSLNKKGKVLISGASVGSKIGAGKAHVILDTKKISEFKKGEVLVTDMTDPDWEPIMKIASAIVTNRGGRTCHAAIISRELGIPCIVGSGNATQKIKTGKDVTVSCAEGDQGHVYEGILPFNIKKTSLKNLKRPKHTKIMMNVGNPEEALTFSFIPNDGVGLAREEFIINSYIKVHPLALLGFRKLKDQKAKREIERLTVGYKNKGQFFVDKLAEGVGLIGAAFYPKDVIVRLSDFKSNEYANLIGGREFEPQEENPMIGWRGASRYYSPAYQPAFVLECKAMLKVRKAMGLTNIKLMIPFCRTVQEGKAVIEIMKKYGLVQGKDGLQIYVMCEIPANVVLAEEFAKVFDGFSIGSNDLTQLTLGLDRDSGLMPQIMSTIDQVFNEKNDAVKKLISQVIKVAKAKKRKIGICGQGPSDFPDFAAFLVKEGIDSISLNPDTVIKTTLAVSKIKR